MDSPHALDAAQALDRALTLDAVRRLDADALARFQSVVHHWSEIAAHEQQRRRPYEQRA